MTVDVPVKNETISEMRTRVEARKTRLGQEREICLLKIEDLGQYKDSIDVEGTWRLRRRLRELDEEIECVSKAYEEHMKLEAESTGADKLHLMCRRPRDVSSLKKERSDIDCQIHSIETRESMSKLAPFATGIFQMRLSDIDAEILACDETLSAIYNIEHRNSIQRDEGVDHPKHCAEVIELLDSTDDDEDFWDS